ncbi:MAG: hypothetical protein J6J38_00520 [Lachnospiraceae bacterium]|nr:hypothetical protein [Lachnospiraceae bacterium]
MIKIIIIIVVIVVMLKIFKKSTSDNDNIEKSNIVRENNNSGLQARDSLDLHLGAIYETYLEMKKNDCAEQLIAITLFPTTGAIDKSKLGVGISIQFNGTWFWPYIENDFIPSLYEVGMYEEFREWKSVGGETGTWDSVGNKIKVFLGEYKESHAEQGEFLNLIKVP